MSNKADNGGMMNKEKYTQIHNAILRHHGGTIRLVVGSTRYMEKFFHSFILSLF
jgi:hypothetical protein